MSASNWITVASVIVAAVSFIWGFKRDRELRSHVGGTVDIASSANKAPFLHYQGGELPPVPKVVDWTFVVTGRGTSNIWDLEVEIVAGEAQSDLPATRSLTPDTELPSFTVRVDENDRIAFEVRGRQNRTARVKTIASFDSPMH